MTSLVFSGLGLVALASMACNRTGNPGDTDGAFGSGSGSGGSGGLDGGRETDAHTSTMGATMTASGPDTDDLPPGTTTEGDDTTSLSGVTADTTAGDGSQCLASGGYLARLLDRDDPFGHFPFLQLFYSATRPDPIDETFSVEVGVDGVVIIDILPRDSDGSSHAGASGIEGTIGDACDIDLVAQAPWSSGQGAFGTIDIALLGNLIPIVPDGATPKATLTLSGGSIPNGPIVYELELVPK